jgi:hypothetical protein
MSTDVMKVRWWRSPALLLGILAVVSYSTPAEAAMSGGGDCQKPESSAQHSADLAMLPSVGPDAGGTGCSHCAVDECAPCGFTSIPAASEQGSDFTLPTHAEPVFRSGSWLPWPTCGPNAPPPEFHI